MCILQELKVCGLWLRDFGLHTGQQKMLVSDSVLTENKTLTVINKEQNIMNNTYPSSSC